MIKAIIFDCFGVLAEDGWLPLKRLYIGDNEELAREIADLGKQNEYGMIANDTYMKKMADMLHIDSEVLRQATGKRVPNEELFTYIKSELKPHYKIGLLSNANYNVLTDLFSTEQASLFDASVMSFESKLIKPDKKMFELIANRLNVEMDQCIFVDDVERYCEAAKSFGMQVVYYQNTQHCMDSIRALLKGKN